MIYFIFVISIFFHELGHFIVSKIMKVNLGKCKFGVMGFSISQSNIGSIKNLKKIFVFLAGPIFNFFIAIIFLFLPNIFQKEIILTNLFLGNINMIPIIPLDGGNILICILRYKFPVKESIKIARIVGKIILIIISLFYCFAILIIRNIWIVFFILYLWKIFLVEEKNFEIYFKVQNKVEVLNFNKY